MTIVGTVLCLFCPVHIAHSLFINLCFPSSGWCQELQNFKDGSNCRDSVHQSSSFVDSSTYLCVYLVTVLEAGTILTQKRYQPPGGGKWVFKGKSLIWVLNMKQNFSKQLHVVQEQGMAWTKGILIKKVYSVTLLSGFVICSGSHRVIGNLFYCVHTHMHKRARTHTWVMICEPREELSGLWKGRNKLNFYCNRLSEECGNLN